jgi:hypothetical protein
VIRSIPHRALPSHQRERTHTRTPRRRTKLETPHQADAPSAPDRPGPCPLHAVHVHLQTPVPTCPHAAWAVLPRADLTPILRPLRCVHSQTNTHAHTHTHTHTTHHARAPHAAVNSHAPHSRFVGRSQCRKRRLPKHHLGRRRESGVRTARSSASARPGCQGPGRRPACPRRNPLPPCRPAPLHRAPATTARTCRPDPRRRRNRDRPSRTSGGCALAPRRHIRSGRSRSPRAIRAGRARWRRFGGSLSHVRRAGVFSSQPVQLSTACPG